MIGKNALRFSVALSAAAATHMSVLAYTMSQSLSGPALVAGDSFSVQLGSVAAAPAKSATDAAQSPQPKPKADLEHAKLKPAPAPQAAKHTPTPPPETKTLPEPQTLPEPDVTPEPISQTESSKEPTHPESDFADSDAEDSSDQTAEDSGSETKSPTESDTSHAAETNSTQEQHTSSAENNTGTPGNAAESNYKGLVMQHLSRQRRPRASGPGSAFVEFRISARGAVKNIKISKSSGSSRFDREAIIVVKKAAPYPKPPIGVNSAFTVEIEGT